MLPTLLMVYFIMWFITASLCSGQSKAMCGIWYGLPVIYFPETNIALLVHFSIPEPKLLYTFWVK